MKSDDCDLLSDCEYPSNIENNSIKRSFSKTNTSIMSDDVISCKKKKVDEGSIEDDINAVLTTSNGYMTRNRLKKELTEKNNLPNEFTKESEPRNKSRTGKRIRNPVKTVQNNKLKLGYVFTHDIFSEKQSGIQHKKNIPSLFESDSESEIESYFNDNLKMLVDVKEKPINTPELECTPAFNKSIEVKTYFNKKTHCVNNISNNTFSDIFERKNQTKTSSSFSYQVENYIGSNECEKILQNENESYEPLEITEPIMNVEDSINDERIIVTDAFIRELEKEIQMENTFLQDVSQTQELSHGTNALKSIISKTEHDLNLEVNSIKPGDNSSDFISVSDNQEIFDDDTNNIKFNESFVHHSENEITSQKYGKMSDFHSTPMNQDICYDKNKFKPSFSNIELHLNTEMISNNSVMFSDENYLKKSKCQCKVFYSFNKDANKILTSKVKHFAFNKNVKKAREKLLHLKHLEANNLKMLITGDKKYTAQLNLCLPTMNSIPMNIKHEKCINLKVNHINEPSMFKDDYEDGDCIPKYISDHKSPKVRNNKIYVQASLQKLTDGNDISTLKINSKLPIENFIRSGKNIISNNNDVKTSFKLPVENCVNMDQNEVSNNVFESSITTNNENLFNFSENKITNNMVSSNNATNKKSHNEIHKDDENKITNNITLSCFTKPKHLLGENEIDDVIVSNINKNNENHHKNCLNFDENKITDNIDSSDITTNHKNLCDENQIINVKNKNFGEIHNSLSITKNKKLCENSLYFGEDKIETCFDSKSTTNTKNNSESHPDFGEYKIADNIIASSISTNKKLSHENRVHFIENKNSDKITSPPITKNKKIIFENSTDSSKDKIANEDFESKITTNNKMYSEKHLNYGENEFADNIGISNISTNSNLCKGNFNNFVENKISDNFIISKTTKTNKQINDENQISSPKNNVPDNIVTSKITTNKKLSHENQVHFVGNKNSNEDFESKITTNNKMYSEKHLNYGENIFADNIGISNISTNSNLCKGNFNDFVENKISDNTIISKNTKTIKQINDENQITSPENNVSDDIFTSKINPTNENQINFDKKKISDNIDLSYYQKNKDISDKNFVYLNENKIDDNVIVSNITTNNDMHDDKDLNWYKNKMSDNVFSGFEKNTIHFYENGVNFGGKNKISDCEDNQSNISKKNKPENKLHLDKNVVDFDCNISHSICEKNDFDFDSDCKSSIRNFNSDTNHKIKSKKNSIYNENSSNFNSKLETVNHDMEIEIKPLNSSQSNHDTILSFSTENSISDENTVKNNSEIIHMKPTQNSKYENKTDYLSKCTSKQPNISLFDIISNDQFENSNCSSDDENRLQIDFTDNFEVNKNSTSVRSLNNEIKKPTFTSNSLSDENNEDCISEVEFSKNEMMCLKNRKSVESSIANCDIALKPTLLQEKLDLSNINENESSNVSKIKKYFNDCISKEACNDLYKKLSNDDIKNENENFSKNIQDILKEMYVDVTFVTVCQHMTDLCDDVPKKNDSIYFQTNSEHINSTSEKKIYVSETQNDVKIISPELSQSIQTNTNALFKLNINNNEQENNKSSNLSNNSKNVNSKQKSSNSKSNMKIRVHFREFIKSNKPINEILESKEFRNLRFFKEEEIACSIGAFIFEQIIEPPTITGLSSYRVNCDQLSYEEKNKLLGSTNLNIICPKIMKLTTITLALVKMLRSDSLIDLILNVIRKNVLNKQMNMYHTIDNQLLTQTVYYVDICTRLRLLKTLQTFIIDSMVFIPNKYCCVIFVSLLLWKNCLPRYMNNEQDPVIIMALSYLIAKKKFYSEQIAGCDIFQRELINLLSFHFNYQFSTDLPDNFIQHIHKPDFFVSVIMFIKCCSPKDLTEFMVKCIFPIIEDYLKTQQNESNALKMIESIIIAIRPFKVTCNATVATYLKKYKGSINSSKKDDKEHIYDIMYHNYRTIQDKFIEYLNNFRCYSQSFEESLVSLIMVLGSVDYLSSCLSLMKWKPKFEPSAGLSKKIDMFKSIIGHNLWNKLCLMDDINTIKCLVNSCLLKKDVYTTIVRLHALC